jgi:hypothetical protein
MLAKEPVSRQASWVFMSVEWEVAMRSATQQSAHSDLDRCDRCGAQAYVQVELTRGELCFCGHHARQYADKLREVALLIHDDTFCLGKSEPRWPNKVPHSVR